MSVRAGFDVAELIWLKESTFGTTPTTGAWKHAGLNATIDPRPQPQWKKKIGLGKQIVQDQVLVKKFAELTVTAEMLKDVASPAFKWTNLIAYVLGTTDDAATLSLEKHLASMSIGAKIDIATPEYWLFKGCKINTFAINIEPESGNPVEETLEFLCQNYGFGTVDYVSGTATRQAAPTSDYVLASDTDILYNTASILNRVSRCNLRIARNLEKKGSNATTKTLFRGFEEGEIEGILTLTIDFDSTSELNDFLNATARAVALKLPSGSTFRQIDLTNVKWREMTKPIREMDLIALTLTGTCTNIQFTTQA